MPDVRDCGQVAYEAWAAVLGWKDFRDGSRLPFWVDLPETVRIAFLESAHAVLQECWEGKKRPGTGSHRRLA